MADPNIEDATWSEVSASNTATVPGGIPALSAPSAVYQMFRATLMAALKKDWNRRNPTITSGGAANVQTLTYGVAPSAYVRGQTYVFVAGFTNTAAATLNVNALGAKAITKLGTTALAGGEILAGAVVSVMYDGTQFQLIAYRTFQKYDSGQQTITAAGSLTLAHGLGAQPSIIMLYLHCTTAELGYSIGDEVAVPNGLGDALAANRGVSCVPDATNLNIRYGSGANTFSLNHKTTGVSTAATNGSWKAIWRAALLM